MAEVETVNYHAQYSYLVEEIDAVRQCVQDGFWIGKNSGDLLFCRDLLRSLSYKLCKLYNIPQVPEIIIGECSCYNHVTNVIELGEVSVVSFLHEWRHHYQDMTEQNMGNEPDCRAYSLGLFRVACPTAFRRAWKHGRLEFMPPYPTKGVYLR